MTKINYQKETDKIISGLDGQNNRLLLHVCCAPCGSYVMEYLSEFFKVTAFYYNPNISSHEEYLKREAELKRLISEMPAENPVSYAEGEYSPCDFFETVKGHESDEEGGERCMMCYAMRLKKTAQYAKEGGYDYFTTTLSVSPYKNAQRLNEIGAEMSRKYGVKYLYSDFKKRNGYLRSIELSHQYNLYRQNYCGCAFSKTDTAKTDTGD